MTMTTHTSLSVNINDHSFLHIHFYRDIQEIETILREITGTDMGKKQKVNTGNCISWPLAFPCWHSAMTVLNGWAMHSERAIGGLENTAFGARAK